MNTFHLGDSTWKSSIASLDGAPLIQARITLVPNAATHQQALASALGLAWRAP